MKCNTLSACELETKVLNYIIEHPNCTIEEIGNGLNYQNCCIRRILEGRKDSRSLIGLVSAGVVNVKAGVNERGNLCWKYSINN